MKKQNYYYYTLSSFILHSPLLLIILIAYKTLSNSSRLVRPIYQGASTCLYHSNMKGFLYLVFFPSLICKNISSQCHHKIYQLRLKYAKVSLSSKLLPICIPFLPVSPLWLFFLLFSFLDFFFIFLIITVA